MFIERQKGSPQRQSSDFVSDNQAKTLPPTADSTDNIQTSTTDFSALPPPPPLVIPDSVPIPPPLQIPLPPPLVLSKGSSLLLSTVIFDFYKLLTVCSVTISFLDERQKPKPLPQKPNQKVISQSPKLSATKEPHPQEQRVDPSSKSNELVQSTSVSVMSDISDNEFGAFQALHFSMETANFLAILHYGLYV